MSAMASGALFETLGVRAALGRALTRDDDRPGGERVVVLGHALWQRQWAGDRSIVGKSILLGGAPWTVVGVMGPDFVLPEQKVDLYVPLWVAYPVAAPERGRSLPEAGVPSEARRHDPAAARDDLATVFRELGAAPSRVGQGPAGRVHPAARRASSATAAALWRSSSRAVGLVLLIACANLANLQMANVLSRGQRAVHPRRAGGLAPPPDHADPDGERGPGACSAAGSDSSLSTLGRRGAALPLPRRAPAPDQRRLQPARRGVHLRRVGRDERRVRDRPGVAGLGPPLREPARFHPLGGPARLGPPAAARSSSPRSPSRSCCSSARACCCGFSGGCSASSRASEPHGVLAAHIDLPQSRYEKKPVQTVSGAACSSRSSRSPGCTPR